MRLTSFTDYGLRILMRLGAEPERSLTTEALASELALSRHHLQKVVQALGRAGWVATRRGAGGGFRLAVPPEALTVGAVVRRLEAPQPLVECFRDDGGACRLTPRCLLRHRLARAREAFLAELDRTTLADCLGPEPALATSR
jgi:Rrf2 family nitric oxide-sensitive transcriptional repressor